MDILRLAKPIQISLFTLAIAACSGGGGGGGGTTLPEGLLVSASGSISATATLPKDYAFNITAGHAYSAIVETTVGDADLIVTNVAASSTSYPTTSSIYGTSSSSTPYDAVSFIPQASATAHAWVFPYMTNSSFNITVTDNHLTVGADAKAGLSDSSNAYYSFNATANTAYRVTLTPTSGNSDLTVYSGLTASSIYPTSTPSGSVGSSSNTGTTADTVTFLAATDGIHYITVNPNGTDSSYSYTIQVAEAPVAPDLSVSIDSVTEDMGSMTINYTVANSGLTAAGPFNVHFIADSATAPAVGTISGDTASHLGLAAGATATGSAVVSTITDSGTAYAIVDPEGAVAESDEDNNVSSGSPWTAPFVAPISFDFEDALVPFGFASSGDAAWIVGTLTNPVGSNYSFQAGVITHSQSSCFNFSVGNVSRLRFDYKVDSELYYDYLRLYKDGSQIWSTSGQVDWTTQEITVADANVHNYRWCYAKSSSGSIGLDTAWVDNIITVDHPSDLVVTLSGATSDGSQVTIDYQVTNQGVGDAPASVLQLWSETAATPVVGDLGELAVAIPALAAGANHAGTATIANTNVTGSAYGLIDTADTVVESNESNNVSTARQWIGGTPLYSFDFEGNQVPTEFVMTGNLPWLIDSTVAASGTYSLRSGAITHSQTSCTAITAASSTVVSFDWHVSSEGSFDYLRFYIDSVQQNSISGAVAWTQKSYTVATGAHEYKWCYTKDSSVSSGSDTGWIDNISIY